MPVALHPTQWWDYCKPEEEKKRNKSSLIDEK